METGNNPTIGCVPPATGQQQQPIIVIVQSPPAQGCVDQKWSEKEHYRKSFPKKTILGLSIFILVAGILQIIFQIALLGLLPMGYGGIGQGIWCGIFPTVAGGLGIASAKNPSTCIINTLMVLSILSAAMAIPNLTFDGFGIIGVIWGPPILIAMFFINGILAFAAGIISIVLSAYTCQAVCSQKTSAGSVLYNPAPLDVQSIPMTDMMSVNAAHTAINNQRPLVPGAQGQPQAYINMLYDAQVDNYSSWHEEEDHDENTPLAARSTAPNFC